MYFAGATVNILLEDVVCDGREASLAACSFSDYDDSVQINCDHTHDVGVICAGMRMKPAKGSMKTNHMMYGNQPKVYFIPLILKEFIPTGTLLTFPLWFLCYP